MYIYNRIAVEQHICLIKEEKKRSILFFYMNYRKYMFTDDELSSLINVRRDEKPWNLLIFKVGLRCGDIKLRQCVTSANENQSPQRKPPPERCV